MQRFEEPHAARAKVWPPLVYNLMEIRYNHRNWTETKQITYYAVCTPTKVLGKTEMPCLLTRCFRQIMWYYGWDQQQTSCTERNKMFCTLHNLTIYY